MRVTQVLQHLGGVADAQTLISHTSRGKVRSALDRGEIVRVGHGHYALTDADEALRAAAAISGVLSHESAAQRYGWELKNQPGLPVVTIPRNRRLRSDPREDVDLRWGLLTPDEVTVDGVTTPGRTIIDCAKRGPFDEALTIADSALRHGNITSGYMMGLARAVQGPGRQACIRVAENADGRAANPFESVLRAIALDVPGLSVEPQVVITEFGLSVRPDLLDRNRRLVLEADSFEFHGKRKQLTRDCERYDLLVVAGWTVLRFAWEHVMFQPDFVRACLEAVCGGTDIGEVQQALRRSA